MLRLLSIVVLYTICGTTLDGRTIGRKLPYLDKYRDVEIGEISHRGITIFHSSGACVIDVEKLSDNARELLKGELKTYNKLRQQYEEAHKRQQEKYQQWLAKETPRQTKLVEDALAEAAKEKESNKALAILRVAGKNCPHASNYSALKQEENRLQNIINSRNKKRAYLRIKVLPFARKEITSMYSISNRSVNLYSIPATHNKVPESTGSFSIIKDFCKYEDNKTLYLYHIRWQVELPHETTILGGRIDKAIIESYQWHNITFELSFEETDKDFKLTNYIKILEHKKGVRQADSFNSLDSKSSDSLREASGKTFKSFKESFNRPFK